MAVSEAIKHARRHDAASGLSRGDMAAGNQRSRSSTPNSIAGGRPLRRERRDHTLQPTALPTRRTFAWSTRRASTAESGTVFGLASQMMRRILVDHARADRRVKRSGQWRRVTLTDRIARSRATDVDILDLDNALTRLAELDPRKSRTAELRFFAGLTLEETAQVLGISVATVEREWQTARAWLYAAMKGKSL
jgi:RNA polymerase sigma factor (TIGR02999 family)